MTARSATRSRTVPPTAINGGSRASAYQQIKEAILGGVLRPLERITEGSVAGRLGLSRTPVREAFGVLAAEGLIVVVPQRGSFVSQLSIEDILEIYQVRTPLECMAARIAAETIDEGGLAALARLVDAEAGRPDPRAARESLRVSAEFHRLIIACVRNRRLEALVTQLQSQVHRVRMLWPSTVARLEDTWKEHVDLLAALRARDADGAERLMRLHLERARASTLDRMSPITR